MPYIHSLILKDDIKRVTALIKKSGLLASCYRGSRVAMMNQCDAQGRSVLHLLLDNAHLSNALAMFDLCVKHGADIEANYLGYSVLHRAAQLGLIDYMDVLVEYRVSIDKYSGYESNMTPLACAVESNQHAAAVWLVENGKVKNIEGRRRYDPELTILMRAARVGNPETVTFLLENGAKVDEQALQDNNIVNALYCALESKHAPKYECAELLLRSGATFDATICNDKSTRILPDHLLLLAAKINNKIDSETNSITSFYNNGNKLSEAFYPIVDADEYKIVRTLSACSSTPTFSARSTPIDMLTESTRNTPYTALSLLCGETPNNSPRSDSHLKLTSL